MGILRIIYALAYAQVTFNLSYCIYPDNCELFGYGNYSNCAWDSAVYAKLRAVDINTGQIIYASPCDFFTTDPKGYGPGRWECTWGAEVNSLNGTYQFLGSPACLGKNGIYDGEISFGPTFNIVNYPYDYPVLSLGPHTHP